MKKRLENEVSSDVNFFCLRQIYYINQPIKSEPIHDDAVSCCQRKKKLKLKFNEIWMKLFLWKGSGNVLRTNLVFPHKNKQKQNYKEQGIDWIDAAKKNMKKRQFNNCPTSVFITSLVLSRTLHR